MVLDLSQEREDKAMRTKEELLEKLENVNMGYGIDALYNELWKIALESGADSLIENFVHLEMLEILVQRELEENSVWGVKRLLEGITTFTRSVYYIDGYGNARDVTQADLECLKDDLKIYLNEL